ncbi:MAG: hypothetical protein NTV98_06010 [Candidatus Roizmanbacteria bacterium]|nr:hypothetical protein [Candidatus Roizmanbacteria bacterium]
MGWKRPISLTPLEDKTMATLLQIKSQKAFTETNITVPNVKTPLTLGCKLYSNTELTKLRIDYFALHEDDKQNRLQAQLDNLFETGDKTSDQFYTEKASLTKALAECVLEKEKRVASWYKQQVTHLLNATVQYTDDDGKIIDITVADTRTAQPVESLWADSEECLVVLLGLYFDFPGLGDSLINTISEQVFRLSKETSPTAKTKN